MNRDKLLMFAALLMACAGFLVLSHSVYADTDELLIHSAHAGWARH